MATTKKASNSKRPSSGSDPKSKGIVQRKMGEVMHEFKEGELNSGKSTEGVKNAKVAIAIGLSEARKAGAKIPPAPAKPGIGKKAARTKRKASH